MDWRRLASSRTPTPPIALSEVRPSIRNFTHHLGCGRQGVSVVPLLYSHPPQSLASGAASERLADFARGADELEIAAIAVATEPELFGGRLEDLTAVAAAVSAPVLRYDCVADEHGLYESRAAGADAVLVPVVVAAALLPRLVDLARAIHVTVVAEVADSEECALALAAGAAVIAVPAAALALAARVPARQAVLVVEGVETPADLRRLRGLVDGVLLGRPIASALDPLATLADFAAAAAEL